MWFVDGMCVEVSNTQYVSILAVCGEGPLGRESMLGGGGGGM